MASYLSKWGKNSANQGVMGLWTIFPYNLSGKTSLKKKKSCSYLSCWFYFPDPSILTLGVEGAGEWGEGCILLKVHSWAKNRTPASCLSAHFWTMLPQEGTFENSNSLPPCNQAVHKHMIDEWSWLSDSALGWLSCESGPESWVVGSTISLNKTLKPRSLRPEITGRFQGHFILFEQGSGCHL